GQIGTLTQLKIELKNKGLNSEQIDKKLEEIKKSEEFKKLRYEFQIGSSKQLGKVMYELLDYPVNRVTKSGAWSTDKFAIKDLADVKTENKNNWLSGDIISSIAEYNLPWVKSKDSILINSSEFSEYKYPFTYLVSEWKKMNKLKTNFFTDLLNNNTDGWYFPSFNMTSAETARITSRIQTLIGHLKKLIIPFSDDYYMLIWDYAQIEARCMAGLSNVVWLVNRLNNPESDYHRESGAELMNTTPEDMNKKQRDDIKAPNFAVPYGMEEPGLAEVLYGRSTDEKIKKENIRKAGLLLARWYKHNWEIKATLDGYRQKAVTPMTDAELPKHFRGMNMGCVRNPIGRRRYFSLSDMSYSSLSKIKRQAGNYPIQSFAREIFVTSYIKFGSRIRKEKLEDKIFLSNLVHDELHVIAHKSVHPYKLYKMIYEECVIKLKGHPTYFVGMNIVNNWYQGKDDLYEAPILFAQEKIKEYESGKYDDITWLDNPVDYVLKDIKEYMLNRFKKEIFSLQDNLTADNVDMELIMSKFKNYFLKPRIKMFIGAYRETYPGLSKEEKEQDTIKASIEKLLLDVFGKPITVRYSKDDIRIIEAPSSSDEVFEEMNFELDIDLDDKYTKEKEIADEAYMCDEDDEEYLNFNIELNDKNKDDEDIILKDYNTATEKKEIWKLIDFGVKNKLYSNKSKVVLEDPFNNFIVDISSISVEKFREVCNYLNSFQDNKGMPLLFRKNKKIINSNRKVLNVDKEKLENILNN
ncbi:MAG: DNA polymerase, partial [Syntrophomonadaceae bacterium]|nr:DNA polymerase [Syntrophomonadaceae bacterium]